MVGKSFVAEVIELAEAAIHQEFNIDCVRAKLNGFWEGNRGLEMVEAPAKIKLSIRVRHQ